MTNENEKNFDEISKALATAAGLEEDFVKEDGKILFAIDDNLGVSLMGVDDEIAGCDVIVASIVVGAAPEDAEVLRDLLERNYLGAGSGDGSFSIEHETGAVVLYRAFPLPMDPTEFVNAFARLVGAARAAKARLDGQEGDFDVMEAQTLIFRP